MATGLTAPATTETDHGTGWYPRPLEERYTEAMRQKTRTFAQQRANELRAGEDRNVHSDDKHHDCPEPIEIYLTESDRRALEGLSPEKKAYRVVCKYFRDKFGSQVEITEDRDGADLKVTVGDKTERIEVKGTRSTTIAWAKLKVSSQQSYHALKTGAARMYRVVNVDSPKPSIYILEFGTHFDLIPEPRWAVKAASRTAKRYPLRGAQYRYDRPYDAVAEHEWRGLGE